MNWVNKGCLALSAVIASSLLAAERGSRITVLFYNYAAVAPGLLAQTEAEADRIFQLAGVEIQWLDCTLSARDSHHLPACRIPPGPTTLLVRILPQSSKKRLCPGHDSFGCAMFPKDGSFAALANVFPHEVEQLAQSSDIRQGLILGRVVTHEIGHLLLGAGSHSVSGIMHVPWRFQELEIVGEGRMLFTPTQARTMRMNVRARFQAAEAAEAPLLPISVGARNTRFSVRRSATHVTLAHLFGGIAEPSNAVPSGSSLTILVYNYAGLPADTLLVAEQEASRIFRHSGIGVTWRPCAVAVAPAGTECPPPGPSLHALRMMAQIQYGALRTNTMGYTAGDFATVSVEYAEKLEQSGVGRTPEVLGHVGA